MSHRWLVASVVLCGNLVSSLIVFASDSEAPARLPAVYSEFVSAADHQVDFSVVSVTSILAEQFPASATSVADVIEHSPSVQIQESGEIGSYQSVNVRGAPSQQTKIYIDGILQSGAGGGESGLLQSLSLADVERIDVYAGASPAQFAQGSPGGAINIVRKSARQNRVRLRLTAGSFGYRHYALGGEVNSQHWQLAGGLEHRSADNNFSYINTNGTSLYTGDDSEQQRNNAEFVATDGFIKAVRSTDDNESFITLDGFSKQKNLPHWNNLPIDDTYYRQQSLTLSGGHAVNNGWQGLDSSLRGQLKATEGRFHDPADSIGLNANDSYDTLISQLLNHHSLLPTDFGLLSLTQDISYDHFELRDTLAGTRLDAERWLSANALAAEWFVASQWTLASTARASWRRDVDVSGQQTAIEWGWQGGLRQDAERYKLQLNLQRSVRIPTLIERFGNQGVFEGNAELSSEQAWSLDGALSRTADHYAATLSLFGRITDDAIAPIYNSQGIGRYINLDSAYFAGVEWYLNADFRAVELSSQGALQFSLTQSNLKAYHLKQVPGYYPVSINSSLATALPRGWRWSADYRYEAGLYYDRYNSTQAPAKHAVSSRLSYQWHALLVEAEVRNLLNRTHLDFSRAPLPGRSFLLSLSYTPGVLI